MILAVIRMWFLALPCRGPADPNSGLNTRAFTVLAPEAFFGQIFTLWGVFEACGGEQRDCRVGGWSGWYYWWRPYNYNALVAKGWPPIKATDLAAALKGCITIRHGSGFDPDHVSMHWLAISWSSFPVFFLAFRYFSSVAVTLCSFKCLNNIVILHWREEGCIGNYAPRGPRVEKRMSLHWREEGCIGNYAPLGPRDLPQHWFCTPRPSGGVISNTSLLSSV